MAPRQKWGTVGEILKTEDGGDQVIVSHDLVGSPETAPFQIFEQGKDAVITYLGIELGERAWRLVSRIDSPGA